MAVVGLDDCVVDAVGFWPGEEKMPEPVGCDVVLEAGGGRVAGRQCPHSSSGVRLFPTGFERVLTAGAVAARKGELCGWRLFAVGLASSFVESPRRGLLSPQLGPTAPRPSGRFFAPEGRERGHGRGHPDRLCRRPGLSSLARQGCQFSAGDDSRGLLAGRSSAQLN